MQIIKSFLHVFKNHYFLFLFTVSIIFASIVLLNSNDFLESNFNFDTLENIEKYAKNHTQNYRIDSNDWVNPEFTSFYARTLKHSNLEKFLVKIGIVKTPIFSIKNFETLIEKVTKNRLNKKLVSPFNATIDLKKDNKCIIFGDLNGAFHSFTRNLRELEKQKIIDNNLKIIAPNTYFIFLGNVINKSPYCLELLNVILSIINKNEQNVFYLRGQYEKNENWKNFSMRRAIQVLFPNLTKINQKNNLPVKIDNFLATLPDSLTINVDGKEKDKIICMNKEIQSIIENDDKIKFMLIGEKKFNIIKELYGLEFFGYECGITKWSLLSCPTVVYKKFLNFYFDAFVELTIGQSAEKSTLKLYNKDTRTKNQKYKQILYDPIFGHALKIQFELTDEKIYNIGSTMGLTGVVSSFGRESKAGNETAIYFNNENSENLIKPIIFDDEYSPNIARKNIEKLLNKYNIKTIISPQGTPTLAFYLDMVKSGKIYVFFPFTGASIFRNKEIKNILHFRPSYTNEAIDEINYLVKECGVKNFAFFYQNDAFGLPIAKAAHEELKKLGITKWLDLPHISTQSNFKDIIKKIKDFGPDAVALYSADFATKEFLDQLGPDFFSERILFGVSFIFSDPFCKFLNNRGIDFLLTSLVPDPVTSTLRIVKEFRDRMTKRGLATNSNSLEGYINSSLIVEAINKITPPVTEEKIMQFFENMKNYKFKGLDLTFNPETRDLSQKTWIKTLDNKWINYKF